MISKIQGYQNNITYCAKIPKIDIKNSNIIKEKSLADSVVQNPKINDKISFISRLKEMFFETFPTLDSEYNKIFKQQKNRV